MADHRSDEPGRERRGSQRVISRAQAEVFVQSSRYSGEVRNISMTGALIVPPLRMSPGTFIRLIIDVPGGLQIALDAVVVRETGLEGVYAVGVQFMDMGEPIRRELEQAMTAFQSHAARRASEQRSADAAPIVSRPPADGRLPAPEAPAPRAAPPRAAPDIASLIAEEVGSPDITPPPEPRVAPVQPAPPVAAPPVARPAAPPAAPPRAASEVSRARPGEASRSSRRPSTLDPIAALIADEVGAPPPVPVRESGPARQKPAETPAADPSRETLAHDAIMRQRAIAMLKKRRKTGQQQRLDRDRKKVKRETIQHLDRLMRGTNVKELYREAVESMRDKPTGESK